MPSPLARTAVPSLYHQPMAVLALPGKTKQTTYRVWAPNDKRDYWSAGWTTLVLTDELDDNGEPIWADVDGSHEKAATFVDVVIRARFPRRIREAFESWSVELPVVLP